MMQFMRRASLHLQDPMTQSLTFIYFDIENFKSFNQRHSFQQGNRFLRYMADLLREAFAGDLVARFNDDHFVVATALENPGDRIQFVHDRIHAYDPQLPMELKAGIYRPGPDVTDIALIMDRAKISCNSIKNTYDLVWAVFDPSMEEELNFRNHIIRSFQEARAGGCIEVFYQPEIRTMTREICGFEALARWRDPQHGMISPGVFVPVLEDAHLSPQLDLYVIEQVCRHIVQMRTDIPDWRILRVSVNLSRSDFRLLDMVQAVENVRLRYDVPRQMINIEVTERALDGDDEKFLQGEIARFRAAGYEVWMDDFGSGYSSLNNVKDYAFDVLKIDMNFLRSFDTNPKSAIVIRSIVDMAKELGMHTLAEGVETEAQFEFLREIGCEKVQGYLFSQPLPFAQAVAYCHGPTAKMKVESFRLGPYYAKIGAINVLSNALLERGGHAPEAGDGLAIALLEEYDGAFTYLYQNAMFRLFMKSIELDEESTDTPHYERRLHQHRRMIAHMMEEADQTEREGYADFITRSSFNSIRLRLIARDEDDMRAVYLMTTVKVSRFSSESGSMREVINQIVDLYDRVDLYDLDKHRLTQLYCAVSEPNFLNNFEPYETLVQQYADAMILPEEREQFEQFYSTDHLQAVFRGGESGAENTLLLDRQLPDGTRTLRLHQLIPFRMEEHRYIVSCIQPIDEEIIDAALAKLSGAVSK